MAKIGNWMMDMLSLDEADAVYHSFRSTTTTGLEIGSLLAGGYGLVKGVIPFKLSFPHYSLLPRNKCKERLGEDMGRDRM